MYYNDGTAYPTWHHALRSSGDLVAADHDRVVMLTNDRGELVGRVEWRQPKGRHPCAQVKIRGSRGYGPWTDARLMPTPTRART